jgi:hypothetical protein
MDRERERRRALGIHASGMRPKDQMPPPERIEEVRDAVKRFAIVNAGHAMKSVEGMGGPNVFASSRLGAPKSERGLIAQNSEEGLSDGLLKVMLSSLSENVPSLKDCTAIGSSTYERVSSYPDPRYSPVCEEVLGDIEELLEKWGVVLGEPRGLYGDGAVGVCGMPLCCAAAKTFVGYSTSKLTSTDCVAVRDELLPVCKKCAVKHKNTQNAERITTQNAELRAQTALSGGRVQNPEPSPEPRGDDVETEVVVTEGDLLNVVKYKDDIARMTNTECDEMLKNREWMVAQARQLDENFLVVIKDLDKVRTELAVKDAEIQDLKDERRDLEEQLEEALDNSDDKACAISEGANIMMAEQFTQTQQNYADLRQYIDQIRAEHAAFVLEAQRADAATAASSQELERVLSDLSDETYKTAKSTYDSSDEPEPE